VDEENVRMSEFIKKEVGDYKKGEAFYEFTQAEDLASYREILHVPKHALQHESESQMVSLFVYNGHGYAQKHREKTSSSY
jgi:hypothetical protein